MKVANRAGVPADEARRSRPRRRARRRRCRAGRRRSADAGSRSTGPARASASHGRGPRPACRRGAPRCCRGSASRTRSRPRAGRRSTATDRRRSGPCRSLEERVASCGSGSRRRRRRRRVRVAPEQQLEGRRGPGRCSAGPDSARGAPSTIGPIALTYGETLIAIGDVAVERRARACSTAQPVAVEEHRRAADDLDVVEAEAARGSRR